MKYISTLLCFLFVAIYVNAQNDDFTTIYEKSNFNKTHTYEQTIDFSKKLANASDILSYTTFGKSARGYDLPLLILDKSKTFDVDEIKKAGKAIILIEAAIHPGEPDGIDAGLTLFRDIVVGKKYAEILENTVILFIPSLNVDGHKRMSPYNRINQNGPEEMGWRTNSIYQNLNRDFLKIDSPELQAWVQLFDKWLPDFFIDCHTTDGADYQYSITYILEDNGNMNQAQSKWQHNNLLPYLEKNMEKDGHLIFPYVAFRRWHDPKSGLQSWITRPALSHGYTALKACPGLLIETHMLKDYKTRVEGTYYMLLHAITYINNDYKNITNLNIEARKEIASLSFRRNPFTITYTASPDSTMVKYKGYNYTEEKSDLTGGPWYKYTNNKKTFSLPYFNKHIPKDIIKIPEFYVITPEWHEVIKRLKLHGVKMTTLIRDTKMEVNSYKFTDVVFGQQPFEGRHLITNFDIEEIEETRIYPRGSYIIDMNQSAAKVALHILEPLAPDSYIRWGFFNALFEQKEYAETYVMEKVAREMIKDNPKLKEEFKKVVKDNPEIYNNQWAKLNWFYQQTPYWDKLKNVYPVGKIYTRNKLKSK